MKVLALLSLLLAATSAERLSRCQVFDAIINSKLVQFTQYNFADWVCMAYWESAYNTDAVHYERNSDGQAWSGDYGIFQINSYWWCSSPGFPHMANSCNVACKDLFNLQASIDCAAIIVQQQGMEAWVSWKNHCKGKSVWSYTVGC